MPELNLKDIAILQAIAYYRFMTALDVTALLFAKGSMTYARGRLSALAGNKDHELNQYLYRFALPSERGNSERIWTLGSRGREYLEELGHTISWQHRPDRLRHVSYGQVSHALLLTRFLVGAKLWSRDQPNLTLVDMRISYEMQEEVKGVIPDGWLLFEPATGKKYAILLELDRGMEQGQKFKQHVKGRLEFIRSGAYQKIFGVPGVIVAYATTGQTTDYRHTRVRAMNSWIGQVLEELKLTTWAGIFRSTAIEFTTLYESITGLLTDAAWLRPDTKEKVRLFE
jgi:Replication-relaxation